MYSLYLSKGDYDGKFNTQESRRMRDDQIWHLATGKPLELGLKVQVGEESKYYQDHAGIDFYVNNLKLNKDGQTVDITIGESLGHHDSDGWTIRDLKIVNS